MSDRYSPQVMKEIASVKAKYGLIEPDEVTLSRRRTLLSPSAPASARSSQDSKRSAET